MQIFKIIQFSTSDKNSKVTFDNDFQKFFINKKRGFNMPDCKQCCGTCKYANYDKTEGYECSNIESEYDGYFVEYKHSCDDWESKDE